MSLFASAPTTQTLSSAIVGPDPYMLLTLSAGFRYKIGAQLEWTETNPTDGGIAVGFTIGVGSTIVWSVSGGGPAQTTGDTRSYFGASGNQFIELTGWVQVGSSGDTTLQLQRGQGTASANATSLLLGSAIYAEAQGINAEPTPLTSNAFTAPTIQQNYSVPNISPIGYTVLLATASQSLIGYRQSRRGITFHNPNASISVYVCPSNQTAVIGQGTVILAGTSVTLYSTDLLNVTSGWNGVAASGSNIPITILEYV